MKSPYIVAIDRHGIRIVEAYAPTYRAARYYFDEAHTRPTDRVLILKSRRGVPIDSLPVMMSRGSRELERDPARHHHRVPGAPSFRQQRFISRKIEILVREGYPPKQAAAIAYRMAGVPPRSLRRIRRRRR